MNIVHELGRFVELNADSGTPIWRYVYGGKAKPFFHPLRTPAGHVITLFEPHDHWWQRGLWFAIKFINGENFWEEKDGTVWGTQETDYPPSVTPGEGNRISVFSRLKWVRPNNAGVFIHEQRKFEYRPIDAKAYALDFHFSLTPTEDLKLDRTPFGTWGGYGGLTYRGTLDMTNSRILFSDGTTSVRPIGNAALWADFSGTLDGGIRPSGGIAFFDHPGNPRHPTPWYGATSPSHYFNAAFLFHEPMDIPGGEPLNLRYRALIHDGIWEKDELQAAYDNYLKGEKSAGG
jgi:methane monooxygenase PmoA-like